MGQLYELDRGIQYFEHTIIPDSPQQLLTFTGETMGPVGWKKNNYAYRARAAILYSFIYMRSEYSCGRYVAYYVAEVVSAHISIAGSSLAHLSCTHTKLAALPPVDVPFAASRRARFTLDVPFAASMTSFGRIKTLALLPAVVISHKS